VKVLPSFNEQFIFVSVPPEELVILDGNKRDRIKTVEPYNEGSSISLICQVRGGKLFFYFIIWCWHFFHKKFHIGVLNM